ncbi:MAG: DUF177 domain-containing protein [Bacteroidota bacterium]
MSGKRSFEIAFVGLKPGVHEYVYDITDKFFADYDQQDFSNCVANIKLQLEKNTGFMRLHFEVGGSLNLNCDRCGNNLPMQLFEDFNIMVKLVDNPEEMNNTEEDPDVYYLGKMESHLNVAEWIFEFINLSIPMQRMCSEEEMGGPYCNKEVLQKLKEMKPSAEEKTETENLWKGLEKFKDLPS